MSRLGRLRPVANGALLLALALFLAGCGPYNFADDPAMTIDVRSDVNKEIFDLYALVFWLAAAVFIIVEVALLYSVFRFRRRPGQGLPKQVHGNNRLEVAWTIAPALMLVVVAIPTIRTIIYMSSPPPVTAAGDPVRIEVIGHQYWWEVNYPDLGVTTANEIHIPVGRAAAFTLTSADVQHSFWVPKLGGKMDLFPNRRNRMWFTPTQADNYFGQCAELCGTGHGYMKMRVFAEPEGTFNSWVAAQRQTAQLARNDQVTKGQQVFQQNGCGGCHYIEGNQAAVGKIAPNLSHVGSRTTIVSGWIENNPDNLKRWIRRPADVKPGTEVEEGLVRMPAYESLPPEDLDALVTYLYSLK